MKKENIVKSAGLYGNGIGRSPEFVRAKIGADYAQIAELDRALAVVQGQDYAVQAVKEYLFGINGKESPKGVSGLLTFIGAPAVGKTFMAELIAKALKRPYLRLDMSSYNDHEAALCVLFGIHRSYKSAEAGFLTTFVQDNPVSVLVLDEFEKAHPNVQSRFFQILEQGEVQDSFTEEYVSFRDTIVIITSNVGRELYEKQLATYVLSRTPASTILRAMKTDTDPNTSQPYFHEALVSRMATGRIILFNKLRPEVLHRIVKDEIARCISYYDEKYGISFSIDFDRFAELVLFGQGEKTDIRTVLQSVREFFARNIERMVKLEHEKKGGTSFAEIACEIDFEHLDKSAHEIFRNENKRRVLVCCKKSREAFFKTFSDANTEIVFAHAGFDLKGIAYSDLSAAVLDIAEEGKLFSKRLFTALVEQDEFPVFVYDASKKGASFETYTDGGASGCFRDADGVLEERMKDILRGLDLNFYGNLLFRANKIVEFDPSYAFDEKNCRAVLTVGNIRVNVAKDAADEEKFASGRTIPNVHFSDIYGAQEAIGELKGMIGMLKHSKLFRRAGVGIPRGVLLNGAPGTGKTMLAKAVACEADLPFIRRNATEFLSKLMGEGAKAIRETFAVARKYAPCILFIDEVDAIARSRMHDGGAADILNALLSEMDGFTDNSRSPVFVIAATNFDAQKGNTLLDEAFLRRFDRKIRIELPDLETRKKYLADTVAKYRNEVSARMTEGMAKRSVGWSLSELELVVRNAVRTSVDQGGQVCITDDILNEAFERYADGEKKEYSGDRMERIAVHEAGHAVAAVLLGITPAYTTIRARGDYGGYVYYADEDVFDYSKADLLDHISIALAGRAAERIFYGDSGVRTGASSDLKNATDLCLRILCEFGMEEEFPLCIDRSMPLPSEVTARATEIMRERADAVKEILEDNKAKVRAVADALLEKISLDGADVTALVKEVECDG